MAAILCRYIVAIKNEKINKYKSMNKTFTSKILSLFAIMFAMAMQASAAETTAELQVSTNETNPEHLFYVHAASGYYMTANTYPTQTESEYGKFAFFSTGNANEYYIYSYSAGKWLGYTTKTNGTLSTSSNKYRGTKGYITLGDSKGVFKFAQTTHSASGTVGYQFEIVNSSGAAASWYVNWFQGPTANTNTTVGIWSDNGAKDNGSCWVLTVAGSAGPSDAVITNSTTGVTGYKKVIKENYTVPTSAWSIPVTIDWDKENLVVNADISGLSSSDKGGLFAVAPDGTTLGWNTNSSVHYKETGLYTVRGYVPSSGTDKDNNYGDKAFSNGKAQFVYSKDKGLSFYNLTSGTVVSVESKQLVAYSAITSSSNIKVGLDNESNRVSYPLSIYVQSIDYSETGSSSTSNLIKESTNNSFSDQTNVKVGLERTLQSDKWNTFCVPFDVPAEMLPTVFGTDVDIRTLESVEGNVINFTGATSIEAGKPYLIKPLVNIKNPVFNGVDIKSAEPTYMGNDKYGMQGTYGLKVLATDGSELFLGADNKFLSPEVGKETMKGMRCFFKAPAGTNPASLRANIDGVETAIDATLAGNNDTVDTRVFNLQGQFVGNTLNNLPAGLYIQNGKKVLVRK